MVALADRLLARLGFGQTGQTASGIEDREEPMGMEAARREKAAYAQGEERPLGSYTGIMGACGLLMLGLAALVRRSGGLPERIGLADLALMESPLTSCRERSPRTRCC